MTFTADASAGLSGPKWLARRRSAAWERFSASSLPTEDDDLWRYSDIARLDLDLFAPFEFQFSAAAQKQAQKEELIARARRVASFVGQFSALVVTVDGALMFVEQGAEGPVDGVAGGARVGGIAGADSGPLSVGRATGDDEPEPIARSRDAVDDLHAAFVSDLVQVRVNAKAVLEYPVVVVHLVTRGQAQPDGPDGPSSGGETTRGNLAPPASRMSMCSSAHRLRRASSR